MAPSVVKLIGKKKRRREKKDGVSTSSAALGIHAPKQRKRNGTKREPAGARCMHLFTLYLNFS
jgi:hypothetical protein